MHLISTPTLTSLYGRDSFERFGDDLSQLLLSYLPMDDRFRYECISRQWQRVIYQTQTVLRLDGTYAIFNKNFYRQPEYLQCIKQMLKKLQNIQHVIIDYDTRYLIDPLLTQIVKHCHRLKSFDYRLYEGVDNWYRELWSEFCLKYGRQLVVLKCRISPQVWDKTFWLGFRQFRSLRTLHLYTATEDVCPLLLTTNPIDTNKVIQQYQQQWPLLRSFSFHYYNETQLKAFDKYHHQLDSIHITIDWSCDSHGLTKLIGTLRQMSAMKDLSLNYKRVTFDQRLIAKQLSQVLPRMPGLKRLCLTVHTVSRRNIQQIMKTINQCCPQLRRLHLRGLFPEDLKFNSSLLAGLQRLTHLTINAVIDRYVNCDERFVKKIDQYFPRLEHLFLNAIDLRDKSLDYLAKLPNIRYVRLYGTPEAAVSPEAVDRFALKCLKLVDIDIRETQYKQNTTTTTTCARHQPDFSTEYLFPGHY